tara:strand:- start:86 stop:652 length:567 start_codon:yes stop_codon:yes gene_type:complete
MGGGGDGPDELESKKALAEQAANALRRYGQTFVPLENMFIQDTMNMFDPNASANAMAGAQNQTSALYEQGLGDMQSAQFNMGLDPTSGRVKKESSALREAQARGMGLAGAGAGIDYTDAAYQGLGNVINMGQGLQTNAMSGNIDRLQSGLDRSGAQAKSDFARSSSLQSIAGTGAGMAYGSYGLGGGG